MTFRITDRQVVADRSFIQLQEVSLEAPGGEVVRRDIVVHPGGVAVVAVADGSVLLIEQYRVAVDRAVLELPAGKFDAGESDPVAAARRELVEETGFEAGTMRSLGSTIVSPGYTSERIHLFAASDLTAGQVTHDGVEERHSTLRWIPLSDAVDMVCAGTIEDAKTQVGLLLFERGRT